MASSSIASLSSPPVWQLSIGTSWQSFDALTSSAMEAAFRSSASHIDITASMMGSSVTSKFDVNKMTWSDQPVRRSATSTQSVSLEYWDDEVWEQYGLHVQSLLADAVKHSRTSTAIYIGHNNAYDIHLGGDTFLQINRDTMRARPIRMQGCVDQTSDSEDEREPIPDDDTMPQEFRCPITHCPMTNPVILPDGHSYEKSAIQRWLKSKRSSPVTGKRFPNVGPCVSIIPNHNLRKLICDHAGVAKPAKKKKKMRAVRPSA